MTDLACEDALTAVLQRALPLAHQPHRRAQRKAVQDYVTDVDLAIDAALSAALPAVADVPVLSEERVAEAPEGLERYWIVDPLDGTMNFMAGLPFWGISVVLVDRAGPLLAAVVQGDGTAWTATRGSGARRDGVELRLAAEPATDLVVLSTGLLDLLVQDAQAYAAMRKIGKVRNLGSQALHLCGVAGGWFGAVCSREARVWDEAAGGLILREAGGLWLSQADTADWSRPVALMRQEQRSIAAHPALAEPVRAALSNVMPLLTPRDDFPGQNFS